jgi:hypothetical protein
MENRHSPNTHPGIYHNKEKSREKEYVKWTDMAIAFTRIRPCIGMITYGPLWERRMYEPMYIRYTWSKEASGASTSFRMFSKRTL